MVIYSPKRNRVSVYPVIFYFKIGLFLCYVANCSRRPSVYSYAQTSFIDILIQKINFMGNFRLVKKKSMEIAAF